MEVREASVGYATEHAERVPKGYKKTEVGVIPEDWDVLLLRDIADFSNGKPYEGAVVPDGRYLLITLDSIGIDGKLKSEHKRTEYFDASLQKGDIVAVLSDLAHGYLLGLCDVIPEDNVYVLNQRMGRLRIKGEASPQFVRLQINRNQDHFRKRGQGTSQRHIYRRDFDFLAIPFPKLAEQAAIAEALSDADALIASLEQLLAKKRHLKQGAMQQLLTGKKRLPGFSGEWEERTLLELASGKKELFDDGDWIESEHITTDGVRLVQTGNIGVGMFIDKDERKYIFEESFVSLRCKEIREGDLLICRLADPAGRACVLPDIGEEKIVTSVDVTIFRPMASVANRHYLANLFSTERWFREVNDRSGGTTHKRIARGALGKIRILIPPVEEQTAIATILSDMDTELAALEEKLAKARRLKQGMMQELLTGRVRLIKQGSNANG